VAQLTSRRYLPYSEAVIASGLQNPVERISFDDLAPDPVDFREILDISVQAGILVPMSLDGFIDPVPYRQASGTTPVPPDPAGYQQGTRDAVPGSD